jgi:acyl-CoA synthetase (AMP-forming)/AMP-acid ligase II
MVQLREQVTTDELAGHVASSLAKYKVPHEWEIVDELPRDANGKVRKRQLREEHVREAPAVAGR